LAQVPSTLATLMSCSFIWCDDRWSHIIDLEIVVVVAHASNLGEEKDCV